MRGSAARGLAAGAVDYRVVALSGEDELAELSIRHVDKPQQQAVFSVDDFEELGKTDPLFAKLDASVKAHRGLWNEEAEKILFEHFGVK